MYLCIPFFCFHNFKHIIFVDVLQCDCPATAFIVILQTVIQELRHLNLAAYRRVLSLLRDEGRSFIFYPNELSSETAVAR